VEQDQAALKAQVDLVKQILKNLHSPEQLDEHPWTKSLIVQAEIAADPALLQKSPGLQLAVAVSHLFKEAMPAAPPKRGKRLDTRWGEFGLLAAQYFAPFLFGAPSPASLREAWGKIDQAILWFVYGKIPESASDLDLARYKLVGDELEVAPNSTLSDWHRKGIGRLAGVILEREQHLSRALPQPAEVVEVPAPARLEPERTRPTFPLRKWVLGGLLALGLLAGLFAANQAWQVAQLAEKINADASQLQELVSGEPDLEMIQQAGPLLGSLHEDLGRLRAQADPPLKQFGPWLAWVPVYGADISAASDLLALADQTVNAARLASQATAPLIEAVQAASAPPSPRSLTKLLVQAQPELVQARQALAEARSIRVRIHPEVFSPKTKALVLKLDPLLDLLEDGLSGLLALPKLLGASSEGPKTYMILVQNEDELRATGGYLSSVGSFVIRDGELFGLRFENTDDYQDWEKPYPLSPWQMEDYMNIPVILLRDSNWSPNFPASVSLTEFLYAYQNNHSVDGVIAINQQALVILLKAIGPLSIEAVPEAITAENVIAYMREAKIPPEEVRPSKWDRKAFIGNMAAAILDKLLAGDGLAWEPLARAMISALDQRQILLQFDDPDLTALVARHAWDGAVRAVEGDFLMSVDTNLGYNKTNALVEKKLAYDLDLSDLENPTGSLVVFHQNRAVAPLPCVQWGAETPAAEKWYAINRCYYNYLRVYLPEGTRLIEAAPHAIPADWMILGQAVPARVDLLDPEFEKIDGLQGFGTLVVVPGKRTLSTSFTFALPARVVLSGPASWEKTYSLKIQKQAGTRAMPLTVRLHLPAGAQVEQAPPAALVESNNLLLETNLTTDLMIRVVFSLP
jgi:hypothetical protein